MKDNIQQNKGIRKKSYFFWCPATNALVATCFGGIFFGLQKKFFFLSGQALTPTPS